MRTSNVLIAIAALGFGALAACAPAPRVATATTTSSELAAAPAPESSEPAAASGANAAPEADPEAAPPAGQRLCKTKDAFGVVLELYVDADKATLHRVAPSGMVEDKVLKVERHGDVLFLDEPSSEDLAVHYLTVRRAQGKAFLRQGDWNQPWSSCQ